VFLEMAGICHKYHVLRLALNGVGPKKTSRLIIKDLLFDGVPVRVYWPNATTTGTRRGMVYLHGGVGLIGSICKLFQKCLELWVILFRLAPEHPCPAQLNDCITATIYFLKNAEDYGVDPKRIVIGGDSSGGTLATVVAQHLVFRRALPRVRAQALFYPFLQAVDFNLPSYQQNQSVPTLLKKRAIRLGLDYYNKKIKDMDGIMRNAHVPEYIWVKCKKWISADNIPEEFKARGYVPQVPAPFSEKLYEMYKEVFDPIFSPLLAEDCVIRQLPETFILTCEYDIVRDDGLLYKKRLEDNGVPVTWNHDHEGFHGILFGIDYGRLEFPGARRNLEKFTLFLQKL
uniref:Alpha/beta hydrolase fold-3 domain-containing protein n=1 Tax=Varanus komodoensis TaxID=61221 RepID=A0A8D2LMD0_VARKO